MKKQLGADAAMVVAILVLGASLVFAGSTLLRHRLAGGAGPLRLEELIGALSAGAGIAVALWWLVALLGALISTVAHLSGRPRLAAGAAAWSPAFMRRLVAAVLGLNLMAAPMAMAEGGATAPVDPSWRAGTVAAAPAIPGVAATAGESGGDTGGAGVAGGMGVNPAWTPHGPATDPGPLVSPARRPATGLPATGQRSSNDRDRPVPESGAGTVVVQGGDSLWSIVATALGPDASDVEVADAWPRWYQANRAVIGPDPNIILPGQVLLTPFS
ncbi:hypothetical protein QO003_001399 [Arthrobacter silviterrae]|uniref:LysM domain-containing protein n=1 Tax=Arthrobacter silviterrae TaxID=2026658 RepID=A0ABX0DAG0_9MICC|nr:hypothetical protein [Arthrobacter silviterrae]MDQ0277096.1 hypothetical protein [Arthrobacter silviterrae]NGN83909.1 hypothetical protein [Arthrobacter silviterrae]